MQIQNPQDPISNQNFAPPVTQPTRNPLTPKQLQAIADAADLLPSNHVSEPKGTVATHHLPSSDPAKLAQPKESTIMNMLRSAYNSVRNFFQSAFQTTSTKIKESDIKWTDDVSHLNLRNSSKISKEEKSQATQNQMQINILKGEIREKQNLLNHATDSKKESLQNQIFEYEKQLSYYTKMQSLEDKLKVLNHGARKSSTPGEKNDFLIQGDITKRQIDSLKEGKRQRDNLQKEIQNEQHLLSVIKSNTPAAKNFENNIIRYKQQIKDLDKEHNILSDDMKMHEALDEATQSEISRQKEINEDLDIVDDLLKEMDDLIKPEQEAFIHDTVDTDEFVEAQFTPDEIIDETPFQESQFTPITPETKPTQEPLKSNLSPEQRIKKLKNEKAALKDEIIDLKKKAKANPYFEYVLTQRKIEIGKQLDIIKNDVKQLRKEIGQREIDEYLKP